LIDEKQLYAAEAFKLEPLVSCWHENETESVAMWKLYVSGREGVAIKTTVSSLIQLFSVGRELKIGRIGYWDVDDFKSSPEVFVYEDGRHTGNSDLMPVEEKVFRKKQRLRERERSPGPDLRTVLRATGHTQ